MAIRHGGTGGGGGSGTVTSVDVSGGTTGLTTSGGPITDDGTVTLGGTLAIASGGTGQTSASDAINALVPTQSGQGGKVLGTDGSAVSWTTVSGGLPDQTGVNNLPLVSNGLTATWGGGGVGTDSLLMGNGAAAVGTRAIGIHGSATPNYSTAIGNNSGGNLAIAATGAGAVAIGGSYASGVDAFAAAVKNNTSSYGATGASAIAMGDRAKATGSSAVAIGTVTESTGIAAVAIGNGARASGLRSISIGYETNSSASSAVAMGDYTTASGAYATALGRYTTASGSYAVALGYYASAAVNGSLALSAGRYTSSGDCQTLLYPLACSTTDATPTVLTAAGAAASATTIPVLGNHAAMGFSGLVTARRKGSDGTESASWRIEGHMTRDANAASTTLVASTVTAISNAPGWGLALEADTTNGGLSVKFTGASGTNIRASAFVQCTYILYA